MQVQCKTCLAMTSLPPGSDPHAHTWCDCCQVDHHHGLGVLPAAECQVANHPGTACWGHPGVAVRPEGCTVCRPVIHFAVAGDLAVV